MIRLSGLTKRFPVRRSWRQAARHPLNVSYAAALQDVTCSITVGEFFGLLGPNGAGKTTLFKILATLVVPDAGTAVVAGRDVMHDASSVRRLVAPVITDERSLQWRLSARENLRLFAVLQGVRGAEIDSRIDALLTVVGLLDAERKQVGTFSSGMKQRLLIARALIARPQVLLLDEPTRSLDPISAREFRRFLRDEVAGAQGCTILLATHNTEEAFDLCSRVAILDHGKLVAVGAPNQLSAELERERYRVWTKAPRHRSFAALVSAGLVQSVHPDEESVDGWTPVMLEIDGGHDRVAEVLEFLVSQRVPVAGLERSRMSLAELIERLIARRQAEHADA